MGPLLASEVILYFIKKLSLNNVAFKDFFYQNGFINEYDRNKKLNLGVT